jgi:hypothetical protein
MSPTEIKVCKCGNTEFDYKYKLHLNNDMVKLGKVSGYKNETYTCTKCWEKYFVRRELE